MWAAGCLASCCASCACEACKGVASGISRRSARLAYCGLFAISLIVSWLLRDFAGPLLAKIPCKLFPTCSYLVCVWLSGFFMWTILLAEIADLADWKNVTLLSSGINTFTDTPNAEWFATQAVLRVSLGNFLFFVAFALIMIGVNDQRDQRDSWHHGGWMMKLILWCITVILMFFLPNGVVNFYGKLKNMKKFWYNVSE